MWLGLVVLAQIAVLILSWRLFRAQRAHLEATVRDCEATLEATLARVHDCIERAEQTLAVAPGAGTPPSVSQAARRPSRSRRRLASAEAAFRTTVAGHRRRHAKKS